MNDAAIGVGRVLLSLLYVLAGFNKLMAIAATTAYFTRLGLPSPKLMVYAVIGLEILGGLMIAAGLFTRLPRRTWRTSSG
jgi:putative oxidoreductase